MSESGFFVGHGDNTTSRAQMIMNGQMFQSKAECLKTVIRKKVSIKNHGWVIFHPQNQTKLKPAILKDVKMFFVSQKKSHIIYTTHNKIHFKYVINICTKLHNENVLCIALNCFKL